MTNSPNQMHKRGIPLEDLVRDGSFEYEDDLVVSPEIIDRRVRGLASKSGSIVILDTFRPMDYLEIPEDKVVDDSNKNSANSDGASKKEEK